MKVVSIINMATPFILFLSIFMIFRTQRRIFKYVRMRTEHLYALMDILASGICMPPVRILYRKIREKGPNVNMEEVKQEISQESFDESRKKLTYVIEHTDDEEKKKTFETLREELDGMYNLYSTLDKNSSPEYVEQVMGNLKATMMKMAMISSGENPEDLHL